MKIRDFFFSIAVSVVAICMSTASVDAASKYKEMAVSNGGSVSGTVTFSGDKPPATRYAVTKDQSICGKEDRLFEWVRTNGDKLQDVVVFFEPKKMKKGKKWSGTAPKAVVDQKGCIFGPVFQIMRNQDNIQVKNSDPILHNIHTYELIPSRRKVNRKTQMNVSQPDVGETSKKVKLKKGSVLKIECDAHDFMHANIFVAHNPYYQKIDGSGSFKIDDIPAGKYTVSAWHPLLGFVTHKKVEVKSGEDTKLTFSYKGL